MTSNIRTWDLGPSPRLVFRSCADDLYIHGWGMDEVNLSFHSEADASSARETNGALEVTARKSVVARIPSGATVVIENSAGDLSATSFECLQLSRHQGDLSVDHVSQVDMSMVHGDVQVREGQSLCISTLHGDLEVWALAGRFELSDSRGSISLRSVAGQADLRNLRGDLSIANPDGSVSVQNMGGDIELKADLQRGEYSFDTSGDVSMHLEPASNAHLNLEAPSGDVVCDLPVAGTLRSSHRLEGDIGQGEGGASVRAITHKGDIKVRAAGGHDSHKLEKAQMKAEAHARRETERAERKVEKARRKGERLAFRAQERAVQLDRWHVKWAAPPATVAPESIEAERLAVLKMLSEGKINAEQAEVLLKALE